MQSMEASNQSTFYLILASLIEAISAAFACGTPQPANGLQGQVVCDGQDIYALIVGIVSIVLCTLLLRVDPAKFNGADKGVALFLAIWWAVAMGYL